MRKRRPRPEGQPPKTMQPVSRWKDWLHCITHLHSELGRLGESAEALKGYQQSILAELDDGFDEDAISKMFWWWQYNTRRLIDDLRERAQKPQPRIELIVNITTKNNLAVEWRPTDLVLGEPGPDSDWAVWHRSDAYFGNRPSNELLFIREVGVALSRFENAQTPADVSSFPDFLRRPGMEERLEGYRLEYLRQDLIVDTLLLQAVASLVNDLKRRLEHCFTVRMVTDIFMEWDTSNPGADRLVSWKIESVEGRNRRLGLAELDRFSDEFGFPLEALLKALIDAAVTRPSREPSYDNKSERATKALKKAGHKITLGQVDRYRKLLESYRPEVLPMPPASPPPTVTAGIPGANVVTFKKPNGVDDPPGNGPDAA